MRKEEFYVLNSLYNGSIGRAGCTYDVEETKALNDTNIYNKLVKTGYIEKESGSITKTGLEALEPYRVNNAVILAAGASTRFIPLSLEQPKGLFEVKGERLIERQIKQLQDAGIKNITVVLGYKKEMFYYLEDKYGVKFIINDSFNIKNNIESLYLARKELKNTYVLMGHSFWRKEFSEAFINQVEAVRESGVYNNCYWEILVKDKLDELPDIFFKEYLPGNIFEFDYFDELRKFDSQYLGHTHSEIIRNIKLVFRCDEEDIIDFRNVSEGMTNTSFIFKIDGIDYIYRHPGDGTESIINRRNEKKSLIKAKEAGVDPTYIYADVNEGWKISIFIPEFREPDYNSFEDSKKILAVLRKLHKADITADYGMKPWEDALDMEKLLEKKDPVCFVQYEGLKNNIGQLYKMTLADGVEKCFCHGDTYKPNWMIRPDGSVILIDWEYSGYSDPGIDVGYYVVDAMYDFDKAEEFIKEYLQEDYNETTRFHYMAYVAIIAYYWFVWAMYRESCGADMGEALENWRDMAVKYAEYLLK